MPTSSLAQRERVLKTVSITEAKTRLSMLVDQAACGEAFVIAKAGRPMVKVTAIEASAARAVRRLGFLAGKFDVPDDFDRMGEAEILELFGGEL